MYRLDECDYSVISVANARKYFRQVIFSTQLRRKFCSKCSCEPTKPETCATFLIHVEQRIWTSLMLKRFQGTSKPQRWDGWAPSTLPILIWVLRPNRCSAMMMALHPNLVEWIRLYFSCLIDRYCCIILNAMILVFGCSAVSRYYSSSNSLSIVTGTIVWETS